MREVLKLPKLNVKKIRIEDYDYPLNQDRIARFPEKERDNSKLLIFNDGRCRQDRFYNITDYLPSSPALVFNETKVFQARLVFYKQTGARIEIFLLEPHGAQKDMPLAFSQKAESRWNCFVGNTKKWKGQELSMNLGAGGKLFARKIAASGNSWKVAFRWEPAALSFSEVIELSGQVPLPPYLHRDAIEADKQTYQTVYARNEGSVAAPTAGLHFTEQVFERLKQNNIHDYRLSLHVGAGTFKPVDSDEIGGHEMHNEQIVVTKQLIQGLLDEEIIIPVGTTSVRSLESLYWFALQLASGNAKQYPFQVRQWEPYESHRAISRRQALGIILEFMEKQKLENLRGSTRLMIVPAYRFHFVDALITNFHQPKSTLLLLVSALIGDGWRDAYDFAMKNGFRFLSYGDSCLFYPEKS